MSKSQSIKKSLKQVCGKTYYTLYKSLYFIIKIMISLRFFIVLMLLCMLFTFINVNSKVLYVILFIDFITLIGLKLIYKPMNDFVAVNRFTGEISMRTALSKNVFKNCKNNNERLDLLCRGFIQGIQLIPSKMRFRDKFYTVTNKSVLDKCEKNFKNIKVDKLKRKIIIEKLFFYSIKDIWNSQKYRFLIMKQSKYNIKFSKGDINKFALDHTQF
ncbi:hypothetical protein HMPREF1982_02689 [Clostridiales bacterium oral taxon 876 str. F0540]|nr:hypothetical protein HMPREF1982_02689 [Clostridiales bacterium oral taxon 876 str. F0540]